MPRRKDRASKRSRDDNDQKNDADRTESEWKKLSIESLRLKCDANDLISTGKKHDVAQRLYDHFHADELEKVLNQPPDEVFDEGDIVNKNAANNNTDNVTSQDSTLAWQQQTPNNPSDIQDLVDSRLNSALEGVLEELQVARTELQAAREQQNLSSQEVLALRSEIRALKQRQNNPDNTNRNNGNNNDNNTSTKPNKQNTRISIQNNPIVPNTTVNNVIATSVPDSNEGIDFNFVGNGTVPSGPLAVTQNGIQGIIAPGSQVTYGFCPAGKNPYPLPALLPKILKLIEQGEYIDFDKLKPRKLGSSEDSTEGYALRVTQDENGDGDTVRLKKTNTNRVENFPEWLGVWNTFLFARLHYQPGEHSVLMAYQKAITQFSKSHKFEAVYSYDIDFRKKIAAERQLAPEHRTTFWAVQHLELKNQHLHNQLLAPVMCYTCKENGHTSRVCPKRPRGNSYKQQLKPYSPPNPYQQTFPRYNNWQQPQPPSQLPQMSLPSPNVIQPQYSAPSMGKATQISNSSSSGAGITTKGKGTCNFLNHKGFCYRGSTCPFRHACNVCGEEGHGGINCMRNTSSSFRPQYHHPSSNGC